MSERLRIAMRGNQNAAIPLADRLWTRVVVMGSCWLWTGAIDRKTGYGRCWYQRRLRLVHRLVYEVTVGPIPDGLTIDHLCRNRACVNPDHLEPVSMRENVLRGIGYTAEKARQTHCKRGHPFDLVNTYRMPSGGRDCRICGRERKRRYVLKLKGCV